jgi:hypothetical protein
MMLDRRKADTTAQEQYPVVRKTIEESRKQIAWRPTIPKKRKRAASDDSPDVHHHPVHVSSIDQTSHSLLVVDYQLQHFLFVYCSLVDLLFFIFFGIENIRSKVSLKLILSHQALLHKSNTQAPSTQIHLF